MRIPRRPPASATAHRAAHPTARPRAPRRVARHRPARPERLGFTIIELLVATVVIGILAAVATPALAGVRARATLSTLRSDLHHLATLQEQHFYERSRYADAMAAFPGTASPGVTLTLVEGTVTGWSAQAEHPHTAGVRCAVFYGSAAPLAPATQAGAIACR